MVAIPGTHPPVLGLGITSIVLGIIALLLFFMPVLGIPISALGLLFGILGFVSAIFFSRGATLRGSVGGIAICSLALLLNLALAFAPMPTYLPAHKVSPPGGPPPGQPWISPPMKLGALDQSAGGTKWCCSINGRMAAERAKSMNSCVSPFGLSRVTSRIGRTRG